MPRLQTISGVWGSVSVPPGEAARSGGASGAGPARTIVCDLDEDEATLAAAAIEGVLAEHKVDPASVETVLVQGPIGDWCETARKATGLRNASFRTAGRPALEDQEYDGRTIFLQVVAPRAGTGDPSDGEAHAFATWRGGNSQGIDAPFKMPMPSIGPAASQRAADASTYARLLKAEQDALRSVPMGAHVPRATWDASLEARYRLLASVCDHCHTGHHPPLAPCPVCQSATRTVSLWKPGSLHTWTVVGPGAGPSEFQPWQQVWGEYAVAVVEYEHGIRLAGMVVDTPPSALKPGLRLEPVFRRLYAQEGAWRYGVKFRAATG